MSDAQREARGYKRLSIYLFVDCQCDDARNERIRVRNLSELGLGGRIEGEWSPSRGQRLTLSFRGMEPIGGRIAWVDGRNMGIAFDRPVEPQRVLRGLANRDGG